MADTKMKLALMKELHKQQEDLYAEKNEKYSDAFGKTFAEYGPTVALVRLEDKLNRAKALVKAGLDDSNGESLVDTLTDLANYANMFLIELAGPKDYPKGKDRPKRRSRKKKDTEEAPAAEESEDEVPSPLTELSKAQLVKVVEELGVTPPKKTNRKKLYTIINKFSMADIAMAITAVKGEDSSEEENEATAEADE